MIYIYCMHIYEIVHQISNTKRQIEKLSSLNHPQFKKSADTIITRSFFCFLVQELSYAINLLARFMF